MLKKLFLILISCSLLTSAEIKSAKERFAKAQPGDYLVTEQNKIYTFLAVAATDGHTLVLEELSLPASQKKGDDWKAWYEQGALGASSHILYEFDLESERILRCYSPSRRSYLEPDTFLMTLLTLPLEKLSDSARKKIGPAPTDGIDMRKNWSPPLVVEGKKLPRAQFDVMRLHWPRDDTPLSCKQIDLYFDQSRVDFPFPSWIEIGDGANTFKIRSVDSGSNLTLHAVALPTPPPQFLPAIENSDSHVALKLSRSDNLPYLHLFALDLDSHPQRTIAIPFKRENEMLLLDQGNLKRLLTRDHHYKWLLVTDGAPEIEHPLTFQY